jgi:glyceraldehyde 3-phosphate dehydrogenase
MIPTPSTGAAKAIGLVMPHLNGKVDGLAVRVPVSNVSLVDLTARVAADISHDDVEEAFKEAVKKEMKGIIDIQWRSLVSIDFNHDPHSAIVDLPTLKIVDKSMVKILAWYDNEWGYANRVADLLHYMWNNETEK